MNQKEKSSSQLTFNYEHIMTCLCPKEPILRSTVNRQTGKLQFRQTNPISLDPCASLSFNYKL